MLKQIVFSLVVVSFVVQAQAQSRSKETGGKARDLVVEETAKKAKESGGARRTVEEKKAAANKILSKYLSERMTAQDKQVLLDLAANDKMVADALSDLVKSKRTGKNPLIDEAQTGALQALAKIPNLQKRISESNLEKGDDKLSAAERTVYNLIVQVPSKARSGWAPDDKAVAAEAIKIFGDEARAGSLDAALKTMTEKMANHPDKKLRATINEEAIKKFCS